jgi:hypothetical protein
MPAPYLLTGPLRSPIWTVGPTGAAGSGALANSPLLLLDSGSTGFKLPQYLRSVSHKCRN